MAPLTKRSCLGLLAGGVVAAVARPLAAQSGARAAFPGWGLLGEFADTAHHLFTRSSLTSLSESVRLWEWEAPGRVLTLTAVSEAGRDTIFLIRQPDGTIVGTWGDIPVQMHLYRNSTITFEYSQLGM